MGEKERKREGGREREKEKGGEREKGEREEMGVEGTGLLTAPREEGTSLFDTPQKGLL